MNALIGEVGPGTQRSGDPADQAVICGYIYS
jgi:hypothetical protein